MALLAGLSAPAEAGKSRGIDGVGSFRVPGATVIPGFGHSFFSRKHHGFGMAFHHRASPFLRSDLFNGTIVPPLRGAIVPPFQIGEPFQHRSDRHFDGFFFGGISGGEQTIIIVQRVQVKAADPGGMKQRSEAQIVVLGTSSESTGVQIFTPAPE